MSGTRLVPLNQLMVRVRAVKEPAEIVSVRRAVRIAQGAFEKLCLQIKVGCTEKDMASELDYLLRKEGAFGAAFEIIVLAQARTSLPHGQPGNKRITNNMLILLDFGAVFQGYHSDLTRVIAFGRMPNKFKTIFNIVLIT